MICPYCKKPAPWVPNEEVYGRRYGNSYMCYYCKPCDAYVGCHNNTQRALGTMANKELRTARKNAHEVIDPIWKTGAMSRGKLYSELAKALGHKVHVGESDLDTCKKIIAVAPTLTQNLSLL